MELITYKHNGSEIESFMKKIKELKLKHYASEAAKEMHFEDTIEFQEAINKAMTIFKSAGLSIEDNFKQVFTFTNHGIQYDCMLSTLAYRIVCLNGSASNPNVACMQLELLK